MTNADWVEFYGFKASNAGKFREWQAMSSSLSEQNPKTDRASLAEQAYKQVVGSKHP